MITTKIKLILLFLLIPSLCWAQVHSMGEESRASLNQQLWWLQRQINNIATQDSINLSGSNVTGIVPLANGGTETSLTDPDADRIFFWDESNNQAGWLTAGDNLTISNTTINVTGLSGYSNLIFSWTGSDTDTLYWGNNASGTPGDYFHHTKLDDGTVDDICYFKFLKTAEISTVTIWARLWDGVGAGATDAILTVDIGGQSNSVTRTGNTEG